MQVLSALRHRLHERMAAWRERWQRHGDAFVIERSQVFERPTRIGVTYVFMLLALLLVSINYQLNLGYLLAFLFAGVGVISLFVNQRVLAGLQVRVLPPEPAFAGQGAEVVLWLSETQARARFGLRAGLGGLSAALREQIAAVDLAARGREEMRIHFTARARGWQALPEFCISSLFPLSTFEALFHFRAQSRILIYPVPESDPPDLPPPIGVQGESESARVLLRQHEEEERDGLRAWRAGDPLKHVLWKKMAKTGEMITREAEGRQQEQRWLDWRDCAPLAAEERLSRLCAWVLMAERAGDAYGLRCGGVEIAPNSGAAHRAECLRVLALCEV